MRQYREEERPIIYMDETSTFTHHTHGKGRSDETLEGSEKPIGKGLRLIIVLTGGENVFVPNAYIRWKSNSTSSDYHHDMNFKKWVSEKFIFNLQPIVW
ncbi:hypothetical protein JTB14_014799 [Gonioctena quinquepunctata]|nr:hypothetical protein JTB14_014799 [Gonioctena quinquepunctata]